MTSPAKLVTLIQPSYANKAANKPPLKPAQKETLWPELKGSKLTLILAGLKRPKITIKAIGIAFRIVIADCILVENLVEIKFKLIKKRASNKAIRVAYLVGKPNKTANCCPNTTLKAAILAGK